MVGLDMATLSWRNREPETIADVEAGRIADVRNAEAPDRIKNYSSLFWAIKSEETLMLNRPDFARLFHDRVPPSPNPESNGRTASGPP